MSYLLSFVLVFFSPLSIAITSVSDCDTTWTFVLPFFFNVESA